MLDAWTQCVVVGCLETCLAVCISFSRDQETGDVVTFNWRRVESGEPHAPNHDATRGIGDGKGHGKGIS